MSSKRHEIYAHANKPCLCCKYGLRRSSYGWGAVSGQSPIMHNLCRHVLPCMLLKGVCSCWAGLRLRYRCSGLSNLRLAISTRKTACAVLLLLLSAIVHAERAMHAVHAFHAAHVVCRHSALPFTVSSRPVPDTHHSRHNSRRGEAVA